VTVCLSDCPSACLSQVGVSSKLLNLRSRKQRHMLAQRTIRSVLPLNFNTVQLWSIPFFRCIILQLQIITGLQTGPWSTCSADVICLQKGDSQRTYLVAQKCLAASVFKTSKPISDFMQTSTTFHLKRIG